MADVSVVIPTYDRPEHLQGAIRTVLGQTLEDPEVIVVDDGSETDYATELAAKYAPVRCLTHDENHGAAAARNTGLDAAKGEYVGFLDDDDRWHERKLERQAAVLDANPAVGIVTCLMASVTVEGEPLTCDRAVPTGELSDAILVDNVVGSPSRVLVRGAALDDCRFDETLPTKHDWDLFLRLCQQWPVASVADHLYVRIWHGSLTSDPRTVERDRSAVLRKHESTIRARGRWSAAMAEYHTNVGRKYLGVGDRASARSHLRRAVSRQPSRRRLALLAMTFVPHSAFEAVRDGKRYLDRRRHDCPGVDSLRASVPGFPDGSR